MTSEETLNIAEETETPATDVSLSAEEEARMREMMVAGVFYGYTKSRTEPKMRRFIVSTRAGVEIIDLVKTMQALNDAAEVLNESIKNGGSILFIGTTPAVKSAVLLIAGKLGMPYVTERWLGGTLTNFKTISERVKYFKKLKADKEAGNLDKYTKKERVLIDQELSKLEKYFGGIESMERLPAMVVIVDLKAHEIAAREARKMKIPIVAFVNTNSDPDLADYPIPANTRSAKSVELLLAYLEKEILKNRADVQGS